MNAMDDGPVLAAALAVLDQHPSMQLATTGGPYSPWVLGVYFAVEARGGSEDEPLSLTFFLEESGKSLQNALVDPRVAFMVTSLDAKQDFVQGKLPCMCFMNLTAKSRKTRKKEPRRERRCTESSGL